MLWRHCWTLSTCWYGPGFQRSSCGWLVTKTIYRKSCKPRITKRRKTADRFNCKAQLDRLLCGSEQQQQIEAEEQQQNARSQWATGYVAETHHRSMYMYVPPHGSSTHLHKKAPPKKVAPY